jgi:hypothetical protein
MIVVSKWDTALLLLAEQYYRDRLRYDLESSINHLNLHYKFYLAFGILFFQVEHELRFRFMKMLEPTWITG